MKTILLQNIPQVVPKDNRYIEPFIGAGTLFLSLRHPRCIINDINPWIILIWHCLASHFTEFTNGTAIPSASRKAETMETWFYDILQQFNANIELRDSVEPIYRSGKKCNCSPNLIRNTALYLNILRFCFGAKVWYKQGKLMCTYGKKGHERQPLDMNNLTAISNYLQTSDILMTIGTYANTLTYVVKDDFVYLDPPYDASNVKNNISHYDVEKHNYGKTFQLSLSEHVCNMDKRGAQILLSNSSTRLVQKLYRKFDVESVFQKRVLSNRVSSRNVQSISCTRKNECLIRNYI